jgi:hypothetical protein
MDISWLIEMGGSPAVIVVFVMGMMFATFALIIIRLLWAQNKDLKYQLGVINMWIFHVDQSLDIDALESGNSLGDVKLHWKYCKLSRTEKG